MKQLQELTKWWKLGEGELMRKRRNRRRGSTVPKGLSGVQTE